MSKNSDSAIFVAKTTKNRFADYAGTYGMTYNSFLIYLLDGHKPEYQQKLEAKLKETMEPAPKQKPIH